MITVCGQNKNHRMLLYVVDVGEYEQYNFHGNFSRWCQGIKLGSITRILKYDILVDGLLSLIMDFQTTRIH